MRHWRLGFLVQCPLMLAFPIVNLLLPGFGDHAIEAGILNKVRLSSGMNERAVKFSRKMTRLRTLYILWKRQIPCPGETA